MGKRQQKLEALLLDGDQEKLSKPSIDRFRAADLCTEIHKMYERLGGVLEDFPCRCGGYDIVYQGQAVELDEERHFNRYRAITLESELYQSLPKFPLSYYKTLCVEMEPACLKSAGYGGNWTNPSCERSFPGVPDLGHLAEPGPPRWRQRAFYDFLKDVFVLAGGPKVVRVPIYEPVEFEERTKSLGATLLSGSPLELASLKTLLKARLDNQESP